jgi:hypothetical protein
VPVELVPEGALTDLAAVEGQMTAGPVPAGAILTQDGLVTASQAAPGHVVIPLTVSPQVLAIIQAGDQVSVFLTDQATNQVSVSRGVRVVTVPSDAASGVFSTSTADFILVEVPEALAKQVSAAGSIGSVTVAIE